MRKEAQVVNVSIHKLYSIKIKIDQQLCYKLEEYTPIILMSLGPIFRKRNNLFRLSIIYCPKLEISLYPICRQDTAGVKYYFATMHSSNSRRRRFDTVCHNNIMYTNCMYIRSTHFNIVYAS